MATDPSQARSEEAPPDPVGDVVKRYVIDQVRSLPDADPDLMDRAFALYDAIERAHAEGRAVEKMRSLIEHPSLRGLLGLLGKRASHVFRVGLRLATDNRKMMVELRRRVESLGLDVSTEEGLALTKDEYERVLVDTVSLEESLENVEGVAESIELASEFLDSKSWLKRGMFDKAFTLLLPMVVSGAGLRKDVVSLKEDLAGDPGRLHAMARLVRKAGPDIVRGAYLRGSGDREDMLTSSESAAGPEDGDA